MEIFFAILIGFPLGFLGLKEKGKKGDYLSRVIGISSYAIPPFWGAMLAQFLFSVCFRIFPIGGRFPIYEIEPQITGFLILDSLFFNKKISLDIFFACISSFLLKSLKFFDNKQK